MNRPQVRVVKVRLDGLDDDAGAVAELLAQLLPELSGGRLQTGEMSRSYPNRRRPGARRYLDLFLLDDDPHEEPGDRTEPARSALARAARMTLGLEP